MDDLTDGLAWGTWLAYEVADDETKDTINNYINEEESDLIQNEIYNYYK